MEEQFPEVVGNLHYEKLLNHLDRRELRDFRSTKTIILLTNFVITFSENQVETRLAEMFLLPQKTLLAVPPCLSRDQRTRLVHIAVSSLPAQRIEPARASFASAIATSRQTERFYFM